MTRARIRLALCLAAWFACRVGLGEERWAEYGNVAQKIEAVDPTPTGQGHIGRLESGQSAHLRFPLPAEPAVAYWLSVGNIVAYSGKGTSYQLILRRSAEDGPVIYEGPVVANGDEWNAGNRRVIDITDALPEAERSRDHLDVYATAKVEGDGWTLYRHAPGRPILLQAAVLTPELRRAMETAKAMARRSVSIIPLPREVALADGEMPLSPQTRIVLPQGAPPGVELAAEELKALVQERTGVALRVARVEKPEKGDIALGIGGRTAWPTAPRLPDASEGYRLIVDAEGARVVGSGEAGCFYGAMTLGQMARPAAGGAAAPFCEVTDQPDFPYRIIQYDIARGQTVNVEYVKRIIRQLARCKINALLFYMEDDFKFTKYPFLGREGTFTHEKARALTDFAKGYHMQLIPQFESLGHASAVLGHEEMKDLREAGGAWVFCTCEPRTWDFLDAVFGELVEAFPTTEFIHVGADEFEGGFGKCPRCRAKVEKDGIGGLYAEHMNRLNQLVRKRGKTMMFWPSHGGPTPELSYMTSKYQQKIEKDCIPTEWIYHGPAAYPEIEEYQKLGFKDVHCCPAVVGYSRVYPDYVMTFRGIGGFYRAGKERGCGGAYCTTWEFMDGALVENSWYGLIFAAECSWNSASTSKLEFSRRFADQWWGISATEGRDRVEDTISDPIPSKGPASIWRNGKLTMDLLWSAPERIMLDFSIKQALPEGSPEALMAEMDAATGRLDGMASKARQNGLTLRAAKLAFALMRYAGEKLSVFRQATRLYKESAAQDRAKTAEALDRIAGMLDGLGRRAAPLAEEYGFFVENCGAYKGDADRLRKQSEQLPALAAKVKDLSAKVLAGQMAKLPPGKELGFCTESYSKVGEWTPPQMSETNAPLAFDATKLLQADGEFRVEWEYTRGAHGLAIQKTQLVCEGKVVSEDAHPGWAGGGSHGNVYTLRLSGHKPDAKYQIVGEVASRGGVDSNGIVWLIRE